VANTQKLKLVEAEMIDTFCSRNQIRALALSRDQIHSIFGDMEPDLVGYHPLQRTLCIGEITTSGYLGQRGKDFHVGAVKKLTEAFGKFYLIREDGDTIANKVQRRRHRNRFHQMLLHSSGGK
jgi:hypothetical protein